MYYVSAQGVDEPAINIHYYYYVNQVFNGTVYVAIQRPSRK